MSGASLTITRCRHCHARFVPRPGPCPRCGATELAPISIAARGTVRAATALESPPPGWAAPHPLCLVELTESVWLLAIAELPLPALGQVVELRRDGDVYLARASSS